MTLAKTCKKIRRGHIALKEDELIRHKHTQTSNKKKAKKEPITGTGNILIMEDDDIIREALGEILNHLGYQIELAKIGEEAIALYKAAKVLSSFNSSAMLFASSLVSTSAATLV